jgi:photosystem II stability/assembly factor-like uncharacterized protein
VAAGGTALHISQERGWITQSWDAGKTWHASRIAQTLDPTLPIYEDLNEIAFADSSTGVILGTYHSFKTTDAGVTWTAISYPSFGNYSHLTALKSGLFAFIDSWGRFTSGSSSWKSTIANDTIMLNNLQKTTDGVLVGLSYGRVFLSSDKGLTWKPFTIPTYLEDIVFSDVKHCVYDDGTGAVSYTTDGGATWSKLSWTSTVVSQMDPTHALIGHVRFDLNTGDTEQFVLNGLPRRIAINFQAWIGQGFIDSAIYECTLTSVFRSTDRGATWHEVISTSPSAESTLRKTNDGKLVCNFPYVDSSIFYITADTALVWSELTTLGVSTGDFAFLNSDTGYVPINSTLLHTTNGGRQWDTLPLHVPKNEILGGVQTSGSKLIVYSNKSGWTSTDGVTFSSTFFPRAHSYATNVGDTILLSGYDSTGKASASISYDWGTTWTTNRAPGIPVYYLGNGVLGEQLVDTLYYSTDNGTTWIAARHGEYGGFATASFANPNDGIRGGDSIWTTTDAGKNWTAQTADIQMFSDVYSLAPGFFGDVALVNGIQGEWFRTTVPMLTGSNSTISAPSLPRWYIDPPGPDVDFVGESSDGNIYKHTTVPPNMYVSSNRGNTWTVQSALFISNGELSRMTSHGTESFFLNSRAYRITKQAGWVEFGTPLKTSFTSICFTADNHWLLGTGIGLLRSTTNDTTYNPKSAVLHDSDIIAMARDSSGNIYAISRSVAYRSVDDGFTWSKVFTTNQFTAKGTGLFFLDLGVTPSGSIYIADGNALFFSSDHGGSWRQQYGNFYASGTDQPFQRIIPITDYELTAFGSSGVAFSTDAGITWRSDSIRSQINSAALTHDGYLIVGTEFDGFASTLRPLDSASHSVVLERKSPTDGATLEIYPNPTTSLVHIENIDRTEPLIITDVLGREVVPAAIASGDKITLSDLRPGVYLARNGSKAAKFVISK